jgi:PAS domain S-box-containing protein
VHRPRTLSLIPWLALAAALLGSFVATWQAVRATSARAEMRFHEDAAQMSASLEARLNLYLTLVQGTAGLFISSEHVDPQEFTAYVESLGVGSEHGGVRAISFAPRVPAEYRSRFEDVASAIHGRPITIWPAPPAPHPHTPPTPPTSAADHFPVLQASPYDPTKLETIGFDLASRPRRLEALKQARDTGNAVATGPIDLVEDVEIARRAFLVVKPLYGPGPSPWLVPLGGPSAWPAPETVEERRQQLKGFIVGAFVMEDVIQALAAGRRSQSTPPLSFAVLDQASPDPLLYQSPDVTTLERAAVTEQLSFGGREWTIRYQQPSPQQAWLAWASARTRTMPEARLIPIIALLGLGFSLTIFLVTRAQIQAREGAELAAAEAQRQRAIAAESERRFRNLADAAPVLIWMTGAEGGARWVNLALLEFTGLQLQDILNQGWEQVVHEADLEPSRQRFRKAQNAGQPFVHQMRIRRHDGEYRWILATGRPQVAPPPAPESVFAGFIGTGVDITDQKKAMERLHEQARELEAVNLHLERLNKELARSNLELTDFAALAAHDLKEPLRGMSNYAKFLREDFSKELPQQGLDMLETIERLASRLTRLLDALMEYARVGRGELRLELVDLNEICRQSLESLSAQVRQPDVEVQCHQLPSLRCDPILVTQVFSNLIANGLKYNTSHPPHKRRVEIGSLPSTEGDIIFVRDNGVGIAPQHHERIFKMFTRLHPHHPHHPPHPHHSRDAFGGGLGAGLAIVKKIIERHGGRIWVASEIGRGTTFYFTLSPPPPPPPAPAQQSVGSAAGPPPLAGRDAGRTTLEQPREQQSAQPKPVRPDRA